MKFIVIEKSSSPMTSTPRGRVYNQKGGTI